MTIEPVLVEEGGGSYFRTSDMWHKSRCNFFYGNLATTQARALLLVKYSASLLMMKNLDNNNLGKQMNGFLCTWWTRAGHSAVHNHFTAFPPGRLMSYQSCCAQETPGGGGGGGIQRVRPSPHQVTPCTHNQEPRNSSLTRWTAMKFCTGTA